MGMGSLKIFRHRSKGLPHSSRLTVQVRPARAYLAGFGTTGSLLAGAAVLFLIATAIVSFRGWPQVGAPSSPVVVNVSAQTSNSGLSAANRALGAAVAIAAPAARAAAPRAAGRPGRGGDARGKRFASGPVS